MSLVSYASQSFAFLDEQGNVSKWTRTFRQIMSSIGPTSHETVTLLTLLSSAMRDGRPLPPYLHLPKPYELTRRLEEQDENILSVRHVNEPGYAAFAVLQLATRCIAQDLQELLTRVTGLVGELDFSFHIVDSPDLSSDTLGDGGDELKED